MKLVMTDGSYFEGTVEEMIAIGKAFASTASTPEYTPNPTVEEGQLEVGDIVVITSNNNDSVNAVGDIGRIVDGVWNDIVSVAVQVPGRPTRSNYTQFSDMRRAKDYEQELFLRMEDY